MKCLVNTMKQLLHFQAVAAMLQLHEVMFCKLVCSNRFHSDFTLKLIWSAS